MVAFRLGEPIQGAKVEGLTVNVVKITVVAFSDGRSWSTVPETVQYAIVAPTGHRGLISAQRCGAFRGGVAAAR